jgi:hypothetical protein
MYVTGRRVAHASGQIINAAVLSLLRPVERTCQDIER